MKKISLVLVLFLVLFSTNILADIPFNPNAEKENIPSNTVIIGGTCFNLEYANDESNRKEILETIRFLENETAYLKKDIYIILSNGKIYDSSTKKEVALEELEYDYIRYKTKNEKRYIRIK